MFSLIQLQVQNESKQKKEKNSMCTWKTSSHKYLFGLFSLPDIRHGCYISIVAIICINNPNDFVTFIVYPCVCQPKISLLSSGLQLCVRTDRQAQPCHYLSLGKIMNLNKCEWGTWNTEGVEKKDISTKKHNINATKLMICQFVVVWPDLKDLHLCVPCVWSYFSRLSFDVFFNIYQ